MNRNVYQKRYDRICRMAPEGRRGSVRRDRGDYRKRAARARAARARRVRAIYSMIAAVLVISAFCTCFAIFSITSHADAKGPREYKYFTCEMVRSDHTVNDIAEAYADGAHYRDAEACLEEICEINHLSQKADGTVYVAPGNCVIVPYYSDEMK